MKTRENIILVDFDENAKPEFFETFKKETNLNWKVLCLISNQLRKNIFDNINRYFKYFYLPFTIFIQRKKYDKIIAWQQFYGLIFAFYCKLFRVKKINNLTVMTFIYKYKKGLLGQVYYKFIRYILTSKYIDNIICYSKSECDYYSDIFKMNNSKFKFVNLGIEKINIDSTKFDNEKFIISVGRSNRDYEFLINSLKEQKYKLKICTDEIINENLYDNIEMKDNVFKQDYYNLLSKSFCIVIPLKDYNISSGQLCILQAMQLRKPVIVTENETIHYYIENNETGFIIEKDKKQLLKILSKLYEDEQLYNRIVDNAYDKYIKEFSIENLAKNIAKIVMG